MAQPTDKPPKQTETARWAGLQTATRRILIGILTIAAIVASYVFITDLAVQNGWPQPPINLVPSYAAMLVPLCIDCLALAALMQFRQTTDKTTKKIAGWVSVGAIAASFAANGLSHAYATGQLQPTTVSIMLIGGIPALTLGIGVYLFTPKPEGDTNEAQEDNTWEASSSDTSDHQLSGRGPGGTHGQTDTSPHGPSANGSATAPTSSPTGSGSAPAATPISAGTTTRRSPAPNRPRRSRKQRTPSQPLSVLLQRVETEQLRKLSKTQLVNHLRIGWPTVNQLWPLIHPETSSPAPLSPNGTSPATTSH